MTKSNILKELQEKLPSNAGITEIKFEGSEIMLYTKSKDFFQNGEETIKQLVRELKKRIELRPDLSIAMDMEKAKKKMAEILKRADAEAELDEIMGLYNSGYQYYRKDILTLLNNWQGELERARIEKAKKGGA